MADLDAPPAGGETQLAEVITAAIIVRQFPALIAAWKSVGTLLPRTTDEKLAATWKAIGTFLWFWADHGGCDTWDFDPATQRMSCSCGHVLFEAKT